MSKFDPNEIPGTAQIWTDLDLAKFTMIAFLVGVFVGCLI